MSKKYHIDFENEVEECHSEISCLFGGYHNHFDTIAEAKENKHLNLENPIYIKFKAADKDSLFYSAVLAYNVAKAKNQIEASKYKELAAAHSEIHPYDLQNKFPEEERARKDAANALYHASGKVKLSSHISREFYGSLVNPVASRLSEYWDTEGVKFDNGLVLVIQASGYGAEIGPDFSSLNDTTFDTSDLDNMEFEVAEEGIRINKYFVPMYDVSDAYYSAVSEFSAVLRDNFGVVEILHEFSYDDATQVLGG